MSSFFLETGPKRKFIPSVAENLSHSRALKKRAGEGVGVGGEGKPLSR